MVPFRHIENAAALFDAILIVSISVLSGIFYHEMVSGPLEQTLMTPRDTSTLFGVGLFVQVYFTGIFASRGNYQPTRLASFTGQSREILLAWAGVGALIFASAFNIGSGLSRGATIVFLIATPSVLLGWHWLMSNWLRSALATGAFAEQRIILIGEAKELSYSNSERELRRMGYRPAAVYHVDTDDSDHDAFSKRIAAISSEIREMLRNEAVHEVVLAIRWERREFIERLLEQLRVLPLPVRILPDSSAAAIMGARNFRLGRIWMAELRREPRTIMERFCKRLFDVVFASVALLLLLAMLAIVAIAIKFDSKGPVIFMQRRQGFGGRWFRICKFRTMSVTEDGDNIRQATANDTRVTHVGRILRRTSIDELPQLVNVLRGEMSVVGPRPHAVAHNNQYERLIGSYAFRHHVKPGITGWAQVNGYRGETATVEMMRGRVERDLWYIDNWSFWLDVKIILKTIVVFAKQDTAY
jgi:undecaprenyl-phosphate galactose phosphotransferase/putative colanic acid biosynthesis UDP-glucose lipid carrier transferase